MVGQAARSGSPGAALGIWKPDLARLMPCRSGAWKRPPSSQRSRDCRYALVRHCTAGLHPLTLLASST